MFIMESVTVCVRYGDYLRHTLPLFKSHFNRSVVVTSLGDTETRNLCHYYNVECVATDEMITDQVVNKGVAINIGLEKLCFREWAVHLDADMVLPPKTRSILETLPLNEQFIYGIDRMMCPSYEAWENFLARPVPQHDLAYVYVGPFPLGIRLNRREIGGYVPLGYFQMFHREASCFRAYPTKSESAAVSDMLFAARWPRTHRHLIPELIGIHLATEDAGEMGVNWHGRKTRRFEPIRMYRPQPILETS